MARWQLLPAGVTGRQIKWRLRSGRLHEIHRGVYLVGHSVPPELAIEQAALLACAPDAILSHRSATKLWDLVPYPASEPPCVTVAPGRSAARPGIEIHRAALDRRDIRRRRRLALTSPPRTILDLAAELNLEDLERLVAEAQYRRLASERELRNQLTRNPGRLGSAKLRRVLGVPGGPSRTRSPAERQMLRLLRRSHITGYEMNARIHGFEVDVLWRELGFAIEIDGYDAHSGRIAFERDRLKAATLSAHGLQVVPITGRQLRDDPAGVVSRLRRALQRGARGQASAHPE